MQYNDTTNKTGLLQDCEFWTGLGDAGISGNATRKAIFTRNLNAWYHKVVTMILQSQDEWDFDDSNHTDFAILTTPLVSGQRDYALPVAEKVLKIKRVDICYDGTGNTCYKAEPFDSNEMGLGLGNDVETDARFPSSEPKYDLISNSAWIYPRANDANVTNSGIIRIEWTREVDEFVVGDTTQEPGFDEPFHRMLSLGASLDYALAKNLVIKNDIATMLQDYEQRLKQFYGSKQLDRNYILKPSYTNYE